MNYIKPLRYTASLEKFFSKVELKKGSKDIITKKI